MPAPVKKGEQSATVRALWSALDAAAGPMSTLILTAGLVRVLSPRDYGVMVIALAASGLVTAINPAIAATTTKFVSEARGRAGDVLQAARVMAASLITVVAVNAVLLLATARFKDSLVHLVFGAAPVSYAGNALMLAVLAIGIQQIDAVLAAGIRGCERFQRQALLEIAARMALAIGVIVLAWMSGDVLAALAAQCVVCAVFVVVRAAALRKVIPGMRIFVAPGANEVREVVRFGSWMWLSAIAGVAYGSADRIIVGRVLGAAAAGQFNVDVQIAQLVHYVPSSLFAFCLPAFSRLSTGGPAARGEISRAYHRYLGVIIATASCLAVLIVLARDQLLRAIGGAGFDLTQAWTLVLLVIGFLVLSTNIAGYYLLLALGRSRSVSLTMTASMLAALAFMVFLIPRYGMQGAAAGRFVFAIVTLPLIGIAARSLGRQI